MKSSGTTIACSEKHRGIISAFIAEIADKPAQHPRKKVKKGLDKCNSQSYNLGNNRKFTKQTSE